MNIRRYGFRKLCVCLLVVVCGKAFAGVGEWKTYTTQKDIRSLAFSGGGGTIWAATSGGLFSLSFNDRMYNLFTTSEGLRSIDLTAVTVDAHGSVWIGASNGLLHRYTPATGQWDYINDINLRTDPSKSINGLVASGDTLYILSDIGLSVFSISRMEFRDTYMRFGPQSNQLVGQTTSLSVFGGRLWVGTRNGIASVSLTEVNPSAPETWTVYTSAQGLPSNNINALVVRSDSLYAGTASGLAVFSGTSWYTAISTAGLNILSMTPVSYNHDATDCFDCNLLFITPDAVFVYFLFPSSQLQMFQSGFATPLTCMASVIFGSAGSGLYLPNSGDTTWSSVLPPGPPSNKFVSVAVDGQGTVWSATGSANGDGFMSFDGTTWRSYTVAGDPRLRNNNYHKVSIGRNNTKWLGNWGAGVAMLDARGTLLKVINTSNGLPATNADLNFVVVNAVATDRNGVAWIANRTGAGDTDLTKFNVDSSLSYVVGVPTRSPSENVFSDIVIDAYGTKWISNFNRFENAVPLGFYYYNENYTLPGTSGGWGRLTVGDGLTSNKVWSEAIDLDGALWVGTDQGISIIFDPGNPQASIAAYHPLRDQIIQAIVVDPLNNKWIGTKQGAFLLSSDGTIVLSSLTAENTQGKLLDDDVASIAINPANGTVYFGTEKGLSSLTTSALTPKRNFDQLTVAPNPFYVPSAKPLVVDGLVASTTLKILSIDGNLVREVRTPGGRVGYWDGMDNAGRTVSTGVYLIVAYAENGSQISTTKIAVIRK